MAAPLAIPEDGKLGANIAHFARALRKAGLPVGTGRVVDAIRAVEAVDLCLGRLADAVGRGGGALVITSDHGNAEMMRDASTGQPHTAHTLNRVPVVLVHPPAEARALTDGRLADIAPTALALLGLPQPGAMTGESLIQPSGESRASVPSRRARA